jgi:cytochrome c oxidase assembly protein subunit 15
VTGAVPPLTAEGWQQEFDKYRETAQYRMMNRGMTLEEFRFIWFWEWVHRQLGRLIGLAYALPLAWFALTRAIPAGYGRRLVALLALGGLQGAIGWWMVQSGLWTGVAVSHLRLSVHLLLALFILAGLVWTARDLLALERNPAARPARLTPLALVVSLLLFVQLLLGAWVAGLRAGHAARDWPLMNGHFFPEGVRWHGNWLATLSSDPFLTHFLHRWWAFLAAAAILFLARAAARAGAASAAGMLLAILAVQILLGIATVVSGVDISLAVLHQGVGALLVAAVAWNAQRLGERPARQAAPA